MVHHKHLASCGVELRSPKCCCWLAPPTLSCNVEGTSASSLRRTLVYLGVGFPWLPLIESRDEPNGPGESQGHYGRTPQISWLAHFTASCGHSWKMWEVVSWPSPHHLQAGSTSERRLFSYELRARWFPHRRRARWTRSCRCRSASSRLTGGGASPRRVLGGVLAKALATKFWCSQELSDLPNGRGGIMARSAV